MPRTAKQIDEGLQHIADWHRWFVDGHTARLAALNLPQEQHDRELAEAIAMGDAVADRMRSDYLSRRTQGRP